jgi:prophage DNA circulation protein
MSTWQDRVQDLCTLTSPSGSPYSAYWRGDPLEVEKRLGKFDYPGADGTRVQDLATVSDVYGLTLFFEGADHDKTAREFRTKLKERGVWTVIHPVEGSHKLQLIKATFRIDPTESGNVTQVDSNWIEPLEDSQTTTVGDVAGKASAAAEAAKDAAASSLATVATSTPSELSAIVSSVKSGVQAIRNQVQAVNAQYDAIKDQIDATLAAVILDPLSLAGDIIALAQVPGLIISDVTSKLATYENIASQLTTHGDISSQLTTHGDISSQLTTCSKIAAGLIDNLDGLDDSPESKNEALVTQTFASAILIAATNAITSTEPATRDSALSTISSMISMATDLIGAFDSVQSGFSGSVDTQYFVPVALVESWLDMLAYSQRYLLDIIFDLKAETSITLDRPRATFELAITEYGANAGNADDYYTFLCTSNHLHGAELLRLPAGKEIVIYG